MQSAVAFISTGLEFVISRDFAISQSEANSITVVIEREVKQQAIGEVAGGGPIKVEDMTSRPVTKRFFLGLVAMLCCIVVVSAQSGSDWTDPHNAARQAVGAGIPDLSWDDGLASYALNWAQNQADQDNCNLVHSGGPYGENIFWASYASSPNDAVQDWVSESQWYDYASNTCAAGETCGHYTQVVWSNTQRVGCGAASCSGGGTFVVCSYDPPGNVVGEWPY